MIHRINLKGPWGYSPISGTAFAAQSEPVPALPAAGTVKFPADWQSVLGDFRGTVKFTRPFNRPTNLEATDRIDLVLEGIGGTAEITLNQQLVGTANEPAGASRFEIGPHLLPHNLLEITIKWTGTSSEPGGLWAPVVLEITSQDDN